MSMKLIGRLAFRSYEDRPTWAGRGERRRIQAKGHGVRLQTAQNKEPRGRASEALLRTVRLPLAGLRAGIERSGRDPDGCLEGCRGLRIFSVLNAGQGEAGPTPDATRLALDDLNRC